MSFARTTAINKLLRLKKRRKIIQGGTWGGKTYGIMAVICNYLMLNKNKIFTIVGETIPALKGGPLKDFKEIMMSTNRWQEKNYNKTERIYTFDNGNTIQFSSFDSVGKAQAAGKRTDLFINEAYYISFEIADTLMTRTSGNIWIDFNPTAEFWAHTEILGKSDAEFIILTYKDNESTPDTIKKDLEEKIEKAKTSEYWANWCRVYVDGLVGSLQGVIFNDWKIVDELPTQAGLRGHGLDFGFSADPTTLVALHVIDGKRYYDELIYQKELSNNDLGKLIREHNATNHVIYADSADPKSISEISDYGINIRKANKGPDSINFGIGIMQDEVFYVTARSLNLIKELRNYKWKKDKQGKTLDEPIDAFNHCIDAARYVSMMLLKSGRGPVVEWM